MQTRVSSLLPLLRSQTQGEMLAWLYLHPDHAESLTDLAERLGVSVSTIFREADRLVAAGLLNEQRVGRSRLLSAATSTRLYQPLMQLLALTFGPLPVLTEVMRPIPGLNEAYIFGSWAARYRGEVGRPPDDIDVLAIGPADADELFEAGLEAAGRLGREVNVHQISSEAWATDDDSDPFLTSVRARPLIQLDLEGVHP